MVIKGLNEGKGRKFNNQRYNLGTTWRHNQKRMAMEDAQKIRRRGFKARVVPISIGWAVYWRKR